VQHNGADTGFSIVEVIIAMFLLAVIALAILPMLIQGVRSSSHESVTATATRDVYGYVEKARQNATCTGLTSLSGAHPYTDTAGRTLFTTTVTVPSCTITTAVRITVTATSPSGAQLADADALVFVP
jgi:prepilin-type N-terminal cleavage/methylation domain-containing protein